MFLLILYYDIKFTMSPSMANNQSRPTYVHKNSWIADLPEICYPIIGGKSGASEPKKKAEGSV